MPELTKSEIDAAHEWRRKHVSHVACLVVTAQEAYPPSGSDCARPELWKGAHWRWFTMFND